MASQDGVAVVVGASSGIGRAVAVRLADAGLDVGVTYNRGEAGARETLELVAARGRRGHATRLDLARPEAAEPALATLADALGTPTVLVNNAGANRRERLVDETVEDFDATLAVNLVGPWACARAFARRLLAEGRGGRIVNVTSILASVPLSEAGAYAAAKAGLEMVTRVMAAELAGAGIAVNAVAPGHTATPMNFSAAELEDDGPISRPVIPLGRAAEPAEIAEAIAFLASPRASYVTGETILVDGGLALVTGPTALQDATGLPPTRDDAP